MLATILKSPRATQTTIAIVEAFAKIKELSRCVSELAKNPEKEQQNSLMQKSGEIISGIAPTRIVAGGHPLHTNP
jgi:hypothetical protein